MTVNCSKSCARETLWCLSGSRVSSLLILQKFLEEDWPLLSVVLVTFPVALWHPLIFWVTSDAWFDAGIPRSEKRGSVCASQRFEVKLPLGGGKVLLFSFIKGMSLLTLSPQGSAVSIGNRRQKECKRWRWRMTPRGRRLQTQSDCCACHSTHSTWDRHSSSQTKIQVWKRGAGHTVPPLAQKLLALGTSWGSENPFPPGACPWAHPELQVKPRAQE